MIKRIIFSVILLALFTLIISCKNDDISNLTCEEATAALAAYDDNNACDYANRLKDHRNACGDPEQTTQNFIDYYEAICNP